MGKPVFTSNSEEWYTPKWIYDLLNTKYKFTLDPCATATSAKTAKYFTKETDGLKQDWGGNVVFVNPPYGRTMYDWVKKCYEESLKPDTVVVMLIPAHTDTKYFHDYIFKYAKDLSLSSWKVGAGLSWWSQSDLKFQFDVVFNQTQKDFSFTGDNFENALYRVSIVFNNR